MQKLPNGSIGYPYRILYKERPVTTESRKAGDTGASGCADEVEEERASKRRKRRLRA